jgi:hypothetical protein
VLAQLGQWIDDYNSQAPHWALGMRSPREYRALTLTAAVSTTTASTATPHLRQDARSTRGPLSGLPPENRVCVGACGQLAGRRRYRSHGSLRPPNERSARISRTTLYREVAGQRRAQPDDELQDDDQGWSSDAGASIFPAGTCPPPPPYSTPAASPRSLSVAPLRITRDAFQPLLCPTLPGAGPAALPAVPHYYEGPDFSLRVAPAFRILPYSSGNPPALRPLPGGLNTLAEDATRSPQVRRSSGPPCRPHTPCLGARCAGISFAVRLPARISALMADRFAMASASATARKFDASPSDSISRWTPRPPRGLRREAAGSRPASCLRIPPARVRRDFHPQEKRPARRTLT